MKHSEKVKELCKDLNLLSIGFNKELRNIIEDEDLKEDYFFCGKIIPDAYRINKFEKEIICYEVEGANPIHKDLIWKYCNLWFILDYMYWDLRLFSYSLITFSRSEIDLCNCFYNIQGELCLKNPNA